LLVRNHPHEPPFKFKSCRRPHPVQAPHLPDWLHVQLRRLCPRRQSHLGPKLPSEGHLQNGWKVTIQQVTKASEGRASVSGYWLYQRIFWAPQVGTREASCPAGRRMGSFRAHS
jgi:hypothetical protein